MGTASFLSELVDEFGVERVGSFRRSDRGLERPFEDAFGISLDRWVAGWAGWLALGVGLGLLGLGTRRFD